MSVSPIKRLNLYKGKPGQLKYQNIDNASLEQCSQEILSLNGDDFQRMVVAYRPTARTLRGSCLCVGGGNEDRFVVDWVNLDGTRLHLTNTEYAGINQVVQINNLGIEHWQISDTVPRSMALKSAECLFVEQPFPDNWLWKQDTGPLPEPRGTVDMQTMRGFVGNATAEQVKEAIEALDRQNKLIELEVGRCAWGVEETFWVNFVAHDRVVVHCNSQRLFAEVVYRKGIQQLLDSAVINDEMVLVNDPLIIRIKHTVSRSLAIQAAEYFRRGQPFPDTLLWQDAKSI